jgi:hypothetical protein
VLFLKKKGQAFDCIKEYVAVVEQKHGKPPRFMRFDNGKELFNEKLRNWAAEKGITIETSAPYSPSQTGHSVGALLNHNNRNWHLSYGS